MFCMAALLIKTAWTDGSTVDLKKSAYNIPGEHCLIWQNNIPECFIYLIKNELIL